MMRHKLVVIGQNTDSEAMVQTDLDCLTAIQLAKGRTGETVCAVIMGVNIFQRSKKARAPRSLRIQSQSWREVLMKLQAVACWAAWASWAAHPGSNDNVPLITGPCR